MSTPTNVNTSLNQNTCAPLNMLCPRAGAPQQHQHSTSTQHPTRANQHALFVRSTRASCRHSAGALSHRYKKTAQQLHSVMRRALHSTKMKHGPPFQWPTAATLSYTLHPSTPPQKPTIGAQHVCFRVCRCSLAQDHGTHHQHRPQHNAGSQQCSLAGLCCISSTLLLTRNIHTRAVGGAPVGQQHGVG